MGPKAAYLGVQMTEIIGFHVPWRQQIRQPKISSMVNYNFEQLFKQKSMRFEE